MSGSDSIGTGGGAPQGGGQEVPEAGTAVPAAAPSADPSNSASAEAMGVE